MPSIVVNLQRSHISITQRSVIQVRFGRVIKVRLELVCCSQQCGVNICKMTGGNNVYDLILG